MTYTFEKRRNHQNWKSINNETTFRLKLYEVCIQFSSEPLVLIDHETPVWYKCLHSIENSHFLERSNSHLLARTPHGTEYGKPLQDWQSGTFIFYNEVAVFMYLTQFYFITLFWVQSGCDVHLIKSTHNKYHLENW